VRPRPVPCSGGADPDAVAVSWRGERLTYAELDRRANRLAAALRRRSVGPEVRVGVCLPRTPDLVAALLGVMGAGGAYVPLDPAYPTERLKFMMEDAEVALVLTGSDLVDRLPPGVAELLLLDRERDSLAAESPEALESGVLPENLSHVIFTSGSTGRPKGVMIRHSSTVVLLHWLRENVTDEERSSVLFSTSINFDVSVAEVFGTLCWGGKLVLAENALELPTLGEEVVHASMVPSVAAELLRSGGIPAGVKTLNLGGEALPNVLAQELYALGTVEKVGNLYGPTEDTTYSTYSVVRRGGSQVLVGRPVANTQAYVLDRDLQPVPVGVPGELYLSGGGLSRGYASRPDLTAERFLPSPFGPPGARMYRVTDRVRWRPDGELEYLGRMDFQVKVRGHRIEPGEIEARLAEHPAVREAVVVAREDDSGDRRLVAYYAGPAVVEAETLRAFLSDRLPEYMVPPAYVWLERLPLTPNGKVDRRALPAPEADAYGTRAYETPADGTEASLAEIWSELLRVERVGRRDSFFELGGHSLLAVQVISRVRQLLGVEVTLGELFAEPVLADFARCLEQAGQAGLPPVEPVERSGPLALSFAQQRLWFLEQLGAVGTAYHVPLRLRLKGELDRAALLRALDRIVARHEALRTTFAQVDGEPEQRIAPLEGCGVALREHDLRAHAGAEAELRRLMGVEVNTPFDLERGPLIRGRLVRMAEEDHVLLLTMHHIVADGWSMGVLTGELSALYGAFRRGEEDPLPELPVQYADYAVWQRRWVDGEVLRQQAEYWSRTLGGAPELLELPTDHARPARQDFSGAFAGLRLEEELTAGLKALSRRQGTTLFMTLLAGWAATLGRLSGQEDVVVGTPMANRGRREIEGLIGFFVNTLALRTDLSGSPSVAELLGRVKARTLEAQQNQDIPFEQVVELVQPARSLAHSPVFQVAFAWQSAPRGRLELPGLTLAPVQGAEQATAKFDLTLTLSERGGRIVGGVEYATALFEGATVERYLGYLRRVLEGMAADERQRVENLPLLPEAERRQVVEGWNRTEAPYPGDSCVHELFEAQARRSPDAVAVVQDDRVLSYAELNARADRLSHHLGTRGAGPGTRVAVLVPRSIELVVAELAILKAGAAYVPLDTSYPPERIAYMVADSGSRLVLGRAGQELPILPGVDRVDVDAVPGGSEGGVRVRVGAEAVAYVMYTSGSTGEPKGVMVPHRAITQLVLSNGFADLDADDRVALAANPAFDAATMEVWGPLLNGGQVVVVGQDVLLDPQAFAALLRERGVTTMLITPVLFNHYARVIPDALAGLRYVLTGGDRADPAAYARVLQERGRVAVFNCYGPTETTTFSVAHPVDGVADPVQGVPIGRPKANTRVYVLDRAGEPVAVGVVGELHVGGAGVAHGYWNRPGLTAERFAPDPFGADPGGRLYRTGDLVRWRGDRRLEFVGRDDFQVKVRGFRIEPTEIEARLAEHPAVREAVVVARGDGTGDRRLVAYYVAAERAVEVDALQTHLGERLPEYMTPAAFVRLERLPLTPTGKVDYRALPAPDADAYGTRVYEAPADGTEASLAEIWSELLRVERVGRRDSFFELGGHSLLAVQVISRVRQLLGVEVTLGELFAEPVLADFARCLEQAGQAGLPPVEPVERSGPLALSFAQQRLWFLEQLGAVGTAYHVPLRLRLKGELDRAALLRALDRIVARHEALRTTFAQVDGEPEQRIAPLEGCGVALREHDLRAHAGAEAELRRLMAGEVNTPFDLERGPLMRGRLVRMAEEDHVLLLTMHHIVADGWSMGVLTGELSALYGAFRRGEEDPLPELPVQYADYAVWQRRWVDGEVLRQQAEYWSRTLGGAPELLELPTDHARPARQDFSGAFAGLRLEEELTAGLKALSRRQGTTLFMTLLAGWAATLGRLSGQEDVVVGTPMANRGRREIEGLIGFFVNTLALRTDLSGSPSVAELLGRVKARTLEAQQNQDIPFEQVVELVQPARSLAHSPVFQGVFAWQHAPRDGLELPGLTLAPVRGLGARHREVRPDPHALRAGRADRRGGGVRDGPLRGGDGGAVPGLPAAGAGGDGGGRAPAGGEPAPAPGGGASAGGGRVEPEGGRVPGRLVRARAVRSAGGAHARGRGAGPRRAAPQLRRARGARQPARPPPARPRRRPRDARGHLPGAHPRAGRLPPGRAQGRRRLRAAGPRLPGRAAGLHAGGRGRGAGHDHHRPGRAPARGRRAGAAPGRAPGGDRAAGRSAPARRRAAREPVARHLHLRVDGPSQGGDDPPLQHRGAAALAAGERHGRGAQLGAVLHLHQLRRLRGRGLRHALLGRQAGAGGERAGAGPGGGAGGLRQHGSHGRGGAAALRGHPGQREDAEPGGRGAAGELAQGLYGLGTVERVGNLYGPTEDTTYSTYWRVPREAGRCWWAVRWAGRRPTCWTGSSRRCRGGERGAVPVRCGAVARVRESSGADGRALRAEPVRSRGRTDVPCAGPVRWGSGGELEYQGRVDHR
jgi:amino acid adenylation domain-containing protein